MIPLGRLKVPRGADTEAAVQEIVRHINRLQELLDAEYSTTQRKNDKAVGAVSERAEEISGEVAEVQEAIDDLPNNYVRQEEGKGLSSNDYTDSEKTKLSGIESGAQKNVKSDWTEASSGSDAYIKNKPNLAAVATSGSYNDLSNKPSLAAVATSGSYNDLSNKPNLASVATSGSYNDLTNKPSLAAVATSGAYSDLSGTPTLAGVATSGAYSDLTGTPTLAAVATSGDYTDLSNTPSLAAVATSGAYSDLSGTPSLAAVATSGDYLDLSNTPSLAAVATSGAYSDLTGKPDLSVYTPTSELLNTYIKPLTAGIAVERTLNSAFVSGGISSTGTNSTNSARARSVFFSLPASPLWLFYIEGTTYQIVNGFKYTNQNDTSGAERITPSGEMANSQIFLYVLDSAKPWVRFSFKRVDGATISSSELASVKAAFKIRKLVDNTLTITGAPADAKTVGDRLTAIESRLTALES